MRQETSFHEGGRRGCSPQTTSQKRGLVFLKAGSVGLRVLQECWEGLLGLWILDISKHACLSEDTGIRTIEIQLTRCVMPIIN